MKRRMTLLGALLVIIVVVLSLSSRDVDALQGFGAAERQIPTARVARGDLELGVRTVGELRAASSAQLIVPPVRGTLQIVKLLPTGTRVKKGDVIIEFDPSEQEYFVEQARSELMQAEQEITKAKADAAVTAAQDQVGLISAGYALRRAELDVSRNELLSQIDGQKNMLNLDEAKRRLEQLTQDVESRKKQNVANLAVLEERRNRERLQMMQAQRTIEMLQMTSPIDGIVAVKESMEGVMFFTTGMTFPEYRQGDLTSSGRTIAEVVDIDHMEVLARIAESERGNVNPGQVVEVQIDTQPGRVYSGKVKTISGQASRGGMFGPPSGPSRRFDVTFELDNLDGSLRPGVTTQVAIRGQEVKGALLLPRQALFEKDGEQIVYVRDGAGFAARKVKVLHRTESRVALDGIQENEEVALVNPTGQTTTQPSPSKAAPAGPMTPRKMGG